jgi:amino acid transporter/NAD(P)-dependent dehydrogenase (short-subunit alcohol dehydrogenase family)
VARRGREAGLPGQPTGPRRLSTAWVFFLVVSAASPLSSLVGTAPLAFVQGDGAGLPAVYLVVTLVLVCFAVGYAAISRRVINTGAFYTYIARGIGRPPAIGAALLAVVAYIVNMAGIGGGTGYFVKIIAAELGADISWVWGTAVLLVLVAFFGYRSLRMSAKVLGTVVVLAFAVLVVFDVAVLLSKGLAALPAASFSPSTVLSGSPGLAAVFALTSFVGVETAALYSEETTEPERSVPKAIYLAVVGMGLFYVFSSWVLVGSVGANQVSDVAANRLGNLVFDQMAAYGGDALRTVTALLFVVVSFAGMLAFHNAASRYLFVLGRDRILPERLGKLHPRYRSPRLGSIVVSIGASLIVVVAAVAGSDPYKSLGQGAVGLATFGIVVLQTLAAVAIVAFFRRRGQGRYWRTLVLPGVGAVGLFSATVFLLLNFSALVGTSSPLVTALPWLLLSVVAAGVVMGLVIRARRPARYARLAEARLRPQARQLARPQRWTRRYCLIGAGPAGLVMARRLAEEGVPFDWFERHDDIGGIWNAQRLGSPVYDGCVSISSKFTSGFPGYPMPADYPDYPSWWLVRDYLRHYADRYRLTERITFNTAVTWVKPDGVGWSATLTSGGFRYYSGIIAAPGTAWNPALPTWPGQETFRGQIWHTARYRTASELAGKRVLVVGAGNSGAEIACEAARAGAQVSLSIRRGHRVVPRYVGGVPTDAVLAGVLDPPKSLTLPPDSHELIEMLSADVTALGMPAPDHQVLAAHPTVSAELVNLMAQGWIAARGAIVEILPEGVRYADGSAEYADIIIAATGYERQLPFLDPAIYTGPDGRPNLYLNMFPRNNDGLAILGLSDFAGATFPRFDDMARAVIVDLTLRELGGVDRRAWQASKQVDYPDMRGGKQFVDSPRHEFFVDDHAYQMQLRDVCDRFGYTPGERAPQPAPPVTVTA